MHLFLNEVDLARESYQKALTLTLARGSTGGRVDNLDRDVAFLRISLRDCEVRQERFAQAILEAVEVDLLLEARLHHHPRTREVEKPKWLENLRVLADLWEFSGDPSKALEWNKKLLQNLTISSINEVGRNSAEFRLIRGCVRLTICKKLSAEQRISWERKMVRIEREFRKVIVSAEYSWDVKVGFIFLSYPVEASWRGPYKNWVNVLSGARLQESRRDVDPYNVSSFVVGQLAEVRVRSMIILCFCECDVVSCGAR